MPLPRALRALVRTTPTIAPVSARQLIAVTGSQAGEFLNGLTAASLPSDPKGHFFSAFLHAQGRVIHDIFLWAHTTPQGKPGYLVEFDATPSEAGPLLPWLKRFVLRSKVKLRDVTEEYDVWAVWGSKDTWEAERQWIHAASGVIEPVWDKGAGSPWGSTGCIMQDRRAVGMGRRLLVRKGDTPQGDHDVLGTEAYTLHRILQGVPEGSIDIPPLQAFPMESNLDVMGGLDFRKGCYVGQELTVRTYHKGELRKRILPVALHRTDTTLDTMEGPLDTAPQLPPDTKVKPVPTDSDDRQRSRLRGTGKLLTSTQGVGLALMRMEQVDSASQGLHKFIASTSEGQNWGVTPYSPDWWPTSSSQQSTSLHGMPESSL